MGTSDPPAVVRAAWYCGSLLAMLGWMLSAVCRPIECAQLKYAFGSGNSAGFISQPSQALGDLKSVSVTSTSSGT